jgi:hypothetical protein
VTETSQTVAEELPPPPHVIVRTALLKAMGEQQD